MNIHETLRKQTYAKEFAKKSVDGLDARLQRSPHNLHVRLQLHYRGGAWQGCVPHSGQFLCVDTVQRRSLLQSLRGVPGAAYRVGRMDLPGDGQSNMGPTDSGMVELSIYAQSRSIIVGLSLAERPRRVGLRSNAARTAE